MDLSTSYVGLTLRNPLIASSSPENAHIDWLKRLDAAGVGAVVLPSLFEEQIEAEAHQMETILAQGQNNSPEAQSYLPDAATGPYGVGPEQYLELIRQAKAQLGVPVIASLNGASASGWTHYAADMQAAGADALELNVYYVPVDPAQSGAEVEQLYLDVLAAVKRSVTLPIVLKIPPYFSAPGHMAQRLIDAGASGLVIFNRYVQPDIDLTRMRLSRQLAPSSPSEMRLPLLCTAVLAGRVNGSLAASTWVENAEQIIKYLLAGADTVMITTALLRHGPAYVGTLLHELAEWMGAHRIDRLDRIRGMLSHARVREPGAYERANYLGMIGHASTPYR